MVSPMVALPTLTDLVIGMEMGVCVTVAVALEVLEGVTTGVWVEVRVTVGVALRVGDGVPVGVAVGETVGVGVGTHTRTRWSLGLPPVAPPKPGKAQLPPLKTS